MKDSFKHCGGGVRDYLFLAVDFRSLLVDLISVFLYEVRFVPQAAFKAVYTFLRLIQRLFRVFVVHGKFVKRIAEPPVFLINGPYFLSGFLPVRLDLLLGLCLAGEDGFACPDQDPANPLGHVGHGGNGALQRRDLGARLLGRVKGQQGRQKLALVTDTAGFGEGLKFRLYFFADTDR